jgi:alpha-tubulin suppressor-like RCC1 family protein
VSGLQNGEVVTALAAGSAHSLALTNLGRVFAWGSNGWGQLGLAANIGMAPTPRAITLPGLQPGEVVTAVAAGENFSLARTSLGRVFAWGNNDFGELGIGSLVATAVPQLVTLPGLQAGETVTALTAGSNFSLALTSLGRVFAWGDNETGELGTGTAASGGCFCVSTPQAITLPGLQPGEAVTALAAGRFHSVALTTLGRVYTWGTNGVGQLGLGMIDTMAHPLPRIMSLPGLQWGETVTALAAGSNHTLALTSHGRVFSWGDNSLGELGTGATPDGCLCGPAPGPLSLIGLPTGSLVFSGDQADHSFILTPHLNRAG